MVKSKQRGFTLIELVVVIVILGILAAFAVPRFMGLETQARVATVKSMGGTLMSAASMAHGVCLAQNCTTTATINGANVTFVNGYPTADLQGIGAVVEAQSGFLPAASGANYRFSKTGAATTGCWVQYSAAAANNVPIIRYRLGAISTTITEAAVDTDLRTQCR